MPLYGDEDNSFSNISYGLDVHAALAGDKSIFESAADVITKGIPLTGLAVVNSFANTAIDIGNFFGADMSRLSVQEELGDGDYTDYYKKHEQGIEVAGLLAGSLIPGTAAIKAMKLLQAGRPTGVLARATYNMFNGPKTVLVRDALAEVNSVDAGLYGGLTADKYKAIALGVGDQALQGLVFEAATAATMKASPILDKQDFSDVAENMFYGALLGGGIGGAIEGVGVAGLFRKMEITRDLSTKAHESATYLGRGNYWAGDKVALLVKSLDDIPDSAAGTLGAKKASATRDTAILNAKKELSNLVEGKDVDVSNSFFDVLLKMKDEKLITGKEMYEDYLARLAKVSRIDAPPSVPDQSVFYVNRFSRGNEAAQPFTGKIFTNVPEEGADLSLGYRMKPFATEVKTATISDEFSYGGQTVKLYQTAEAAWQDGHDIFIGAGGKTFINPRAPNIERAARPGESRVLTPKEEILFRKTGNLPVGSKPLLGAGVTLNTITGAITESATPVVGDFGRVSLFDKGLIFGDKSSLQSMTTRITSQTPTIDANARYVWAAQRGIKAGDTIGTNDIPMLEQLYRESLLEKDGYAAWQAKATKRGISIENDANGLPQTPDDLLNMIRQGKDNLINEVMSDSKNLKLGADEIALRANIPESYLENAFKAEKPTDYMIDPGQHAQVNHVKLEYDIGDITQPDGQILRGIQDVQYRVKLIQDANKTAAASYFGVGWEKFISTLKSTDANIGGVGSKMFSASNAAYNTLAQQMERIGREVTTWVTKRMSANSQVLSSATNAIRDDMQASAELGMFVAVRRRTSEQFRFVPADMLSNSAYASHNLTSDTVVLSKSLTKDMKTGATIWNPDYVPEGFTAGKNVAGVESKGLYTKYNLGSKIADFERANQQINDARIIARNNWYTTQGLSRSVEPGNLYAPSVDTSKYPHFALVKARPGSGMADDSVSIITAENAKDLEQKIASLRDDFSIYTKSDLKKYHEVLGDYDYNRNFAENAVDTALRKRGVLNNIFPDTRSETIIKDYVDWHTKQELRLARDHVEIGNAQLFAELRAMGDRFTAAETSRTGFTPASLGRTAPNPYNSYIKTALGVSEKDEYRLWHDANEMLEAFFSTAFRAGKASFTAASKGMISFEEASKEAEKFGLGNVYGAASNSAKAYYNIANKLPPERTLSKFVSVANSILSATAIRLDVFQSAINAISTPVLLLAEANSARSQAMKDLLTTELPDGAGRSIPATSKLFYNSVENYFNSTTRAKYMPMYRDIGAVRDQAIDVHHAMIAELALPYGKFAESGLVKRTKSAVDMASTLTGSKLSEEFGRFIAADTGRQIFEAAGYEGKDLTDNISTFVNRVHGNYVASQRPVAFQGPIGQAIGLFQTYQFNLMQQLFRYVENGEGKTLSILAGMQTSLFGLQGLPGFQAINNHIVGNAAGNPSHKDIYSTIPNFFDPKLGNYLLYGVASNWLNTGLYSRGDINPRNITILPFNPADYPAISGGIRLIGSMLDIGSKIANGGAIGSSLLLGLEHNGLSRPLSGLGQLAQGFVSSGKGQLIATPDGGSSTMGLSEMFSAANFARLAGARPLEEAISMDALYRKTLYTAKDTARITSLGEAAKTYLYDNGRIDPEQLQDFTHRYASAGGQIQQFGREVMKWTKEANSSVVNEIFSHLNKPINQQMLQIMGGQKLPDFARTGSTAQASTEVAPTGQ